MRKNMNAADRSNTRQLATTVETIRLGAIAGAAGGLAEIAWVTLYAGATGANPAMLARGVTTAVGVSALLPDNAVALGVTVHMAIAVALGVALAFAWKTMTSLRPQAIGLFPFMAAALAGVWAINFFVVLPTVSPAFVQMVPYSVSLVSKLLFGVAAAGVLRLLAAPALTLQRARIAPRS
jgi:hypothetical protein